MTRQQITISFGPLESNGFHWNHGDTFRYRTWLALRILDRKSAKFYFRTTS